VVHLVSLHLPAFLLFVDFRAFSKDFCGKLLEAFLCGIFFGNHT
jgi:hypothetical protein